VLLSCAFYLCLVVVSHVYISLVVFVGAVCVCVAVLTLFRCCVVCSGSKFIVSVCVVLYI